MASLPEVAARVRALVAELDSERSRRLAAEESLATLERSEREKSRAKDRREAGLEKSAGKVVLGSHSRSNRPNVVLEERVHVLERMVREREDALERLATVNDALVERLESQVSADARAREIAEARAHEAVAEAQAAKAQAKTLRAEVETLRAEQVTRERRASAAAGGAAEALRDAEDRARTATQRAEDAEEKAQRFGSEKERSTKAMRQALKRATAAEEEVKSLQEELVKTKERLERAERRAEMAQKRAKRGQEAEKLIETTQTQLTEARDRAQNLEQRLRNALGAQRRAEGARTAALKERLQEARQELEQSEQAERECGKRCQALQDHIDHLEHTLDRAGQMLARAMAKIEAYEATKPTEAPEPSDTAPAPEAHPLKSQLDRVQALLGPHTTYRQQTTSESSEQDAPPAVQRLEATIRTLRQQQAALEERIGHALADRATKDRLLDEAKSEAAGWKEEALQLRQSLAKDEKDEK